MMGYQMEPLTLLGVLLLGLIAGAAAAGALMKGNKGPNFAAGEAELADLKARLDERDKLTQELRRELP